MTAMHPTADDEPERPHREIDDLITRHFDGGLDAVEQRRLAALLDASPVARATFARYLRLEGGLIRLAAAGLVGRPAEGDAAMTPQPRTRASSSPGPRRVALARAGGLAAAVVVAILAVGRPGSGRSRGGDVALVADRWLELRSTDAGAEPDLQDSEGQEAEGDEPDSMPAAPPAWLVAAVADEEAGQPPPDEG